MDDVVRVAVEKGQAELPGHLPNLKLRKVFPFLLLLIDQAIHVAAFGHFHRDEKALLLLLRVFGRVILLLYVGLVSLMAPRKVSAVFVQGSGAVLGRKLANHLPFNLSINE